MWSFESLCAYVVKRYETPLYSKGKNCPSIFLPLFTTGTPSSMGSSESDITPSANALITKALRGRSLLFSPEPCRVSE